MIEKNAFSSREPASRADQGPGQAFAGKRFKAKADLVARQLLRPSVPFLNPLFTVTNKSQVLRQTNRAEFHSLFNGTRGEVGGAGGAP
jgi:hypothetical protein